MRVCEREIISLLITYSIALTEEEGGTGKREKERADSELVF